MAYSTISKPSLHFNTKLYTGNASTQAITGVGFQPDWTWIKNRSTTNSHVLTDAVRGVDKTLITNSNGAENAGSTNIGSFDSDGFTLGSNGGTNGSGNSVVSWNWKAGTGQGSSNTDGSINTTYTSVNTTAGFSISSYTGTGSAGTIGHGLGSTPKMIIVKKRSGAANWYTYHQSLGNNKRLSLNETDASATDNNAWNQTTPTSSVFSVGASGTTNASGATTIAYCFAEKKGYSKIGSYIGNGNANGAFVYTGFKPAWVMIKYINAGEGWIIHDNRRNGFNPDNDFLYANTNGAEVSSTHLDILSNGFKTRSTNGVVNGNGNTYIYLAFAEEPLVANVGASVPATAR